MSAVFRSLLLLLAPVAFAQQSLPGISSQFFDIPRVPLVDSGELRFGVQFSKFEAKDANGRTWRVEDLTGKFTLLYIWSTLEARTEDRFDRYSRLTSYVNLAELQRFYDKVKTSRNIQVLTFCRDYESGDSVRAQDYMKAKGYDFPVITDYVAIHQLFDGNSPWVLHDRTLWSGHWVINPHGQLAYPVRSWSFGRLLFELERAAN
jgi:peroxiredoxin